MDRPPTELSDKTAALADTRVLQEGKKGEGSSHVLSLLYLES